MHHQNKFGKSEEVRRRRRIKDSQKKHILRLYLRYKSKNCQGKENAWVVHLITQHLFLPAVSYTKGIKLPEIIHLRCVKVRNKSVCIVLLPRRGMPKKTIKGKHSVVFGK